MTTDEKQKIIDDVREVVTIIETTFNQEVDITIDMLSHLNNALVLLGAQPPEASSEPDTTE